MVATVRAPLLALAQALAERLELAGDLRGLVLELLLGVVRLAPPRETDRGDSGDHEHADRDPGHREDEPGPERAAGLGHVERAGLVLSIR